jgi:hypothetical protein
MGSLDHAGSGLDVPATLDLAVSRLWDGPGGGGGGGGGEGDEGSGWWRLGEGHRAVGSSYSDDGGVTVMLEEAVNWFCTGNATANQTQTVPIGQDVPCFTLAVPSLVLSLFAIVSLSSLVHYLFVLKPMSAPSIPEAPIHVGGKAFRRLLLALHILVFGVCLSLILPLHLPLPAWHNGFSLGVSETVWISLCSASWALSLLMLLRVHCDATRPEAELWFLTTWWSFNALACLPLVTALSNVLIKVTHHPTPFQFPSSATSPAPSPPTPPYPTPPHPSSFTYSVMPHFETHPFCGESHHWVNPLFQFSLPNFPSEKLQERPILYPCRTRLGILMRPTAHLQISSPSPPRSHPKRAQTSCSSSPPPRNSVSRRPGCCESSSSPHLAARASPVAQTQEEEEEEEEEEEQQQQAGRARILRD